MKSRKRFITMSTDRSKKKKTKRFLQAERVKIIEYALIGFIVLMFVGLSVLYGLKRSAEDAPAAPTEEASPSPDTAIRGMHLLNALEDAGFTVVRENGAYRLTSSGGVSFDMQMESDRDGILSLAFETLLCTDPEGDALVHQTLREENRKTVDALRALFDAVMPVFRKTVSDSETIVKQCQNTVKSGASYAKSLGQYGVRILSDPNVVPQTVRITLERNP